MINIEEIDREEQRMRAKIAAKNAAWKAKIDRDILARAIVLAIPLLLLALAVSFFMVLAFA